MFESADLSGKKQENKHPNGCHFYAKDWKNTSSSLINITCTEH
jgi:hypothetical protein